MKQWLSKAVATCGFLGYLPLLINSTQTPLSGAGFIGTLVGLFSLPLLPAAPAACVIVLIGATFLSVSTADYAEQFLRRKDDPRIIIDEWVGYWVSIAFLPRAWNYVIAAFVIFRILDVWKPLGIRRLAVIRGGWGIVIDDVVAGLLTNVILQGARVLHSYF